MSDFNYDRLNIIDGTELRKIINSYLNNEFNKSLAKLFSVGVFAGLITAVSMPMLAEIYGPETLGKYQVILSLILLLSGISSLRFDFAMLLPKKKYQSSILYKISLSSIIITTLIFLTLSMIFNEQLHSYLKIEGGLEYSLYLTVAVTFSGLMQLTQMVFVRDANFSELSLNKAVHVMLVNLGAIVIGSFYPEYTTLVLSFLCATILVVLMNFFKISQKRKYTFLPIPLLFKYTIKYKKYPTINTATNLLNSFSINMPIFVITYRYGLVEVGMFMMASRILDLPLSLIFSSLNQVYAKYASDDYKLGANFLKLRYYKTLKKLLVISCMYSFAIVIFVIFFVDIFFDEEWSALPEYIFIMLLPKVGQLCVSPLSTTLNILNKEEWGFLSIFLFVIVRYFSLTFFTDFMEGLILYSFVTAIFYVVMSLLNSYFIRGELNEKQN
ncbi:oligosaccharide flippase family protein [Vibrio cyclitrophicus]